MEHSSTLESLWLSAYELRDFRVDLAFLNKFERLSSLTLDLTQSELDTPLPEEIFTSLTSLHLCTCTKTRRTSSCIFLLSRLTSLTLECKFDDEDKSEFRHFSNLVHLTNLKVKYYFADMRYDIYPFDMRDSDYIFPLNSLASLIKLEELYVSFRLNEFSKFDILLNFTGLKYLRINSVRDRNQFHVLSQLPKLTHLVLIDGGYFPHDSLKHINLLSNLRSLETNINLGFALVVGNFPRLRNLYFDIYVNDCRMAIIRNRFPHAKVTCLGDEECASYTLHVYGHIFLL